MSEPIRCHWPNNDRLIRYHDEEWGAPIHDDSRLFEALILGGAQAGLSWDTILRRRDGYRRAFAEFDPERVARFTPARVERMLADPGIIRNRMKINSAVSNARALLKVRDELGGFDPYIWRFVEGRTIQNRWTRHKDLPARTPVSDAMSKDLRSRGFSFVGSTICYAFMQAVGMVNDHLVDCFRYDQLRRGGSRGGKLR
jgi:DNA-3-methyladenine glycosylase I